MLILESLYWYYGGVDPLLSPIYVSRVKCYASRNVEDNIASCQKRCCGRLSAFVQFLVVLSETEPLFRVNQTAARRALLVRLVGSLLLLFFVCIGYLCL